MVGQVWADTDKKKAYLIGLIPTYQVTMGAEKKGISNLTQRNWLREKLAEYRQLFGKLRTYLNNHAAEMRRSKKTKKADDIIAGKQTRKRSVTANPNKTNFRMGGEDAEARLSKAFDEHCVDNGISPDKRPLAFLGFRSSHLKKEFDALGSDEQDEVKRAMADEKDMNEEYEREKYHWSDRAEIDDKEVVRRHEGMEHYQLVNQIPQLVEALENRLEDTLEAIVVVMVGYRQPMKGGGPRFVSSIRGRGLNATTFDKQFGETWGNLKRDFATHIGGAWSPESMARLAVPVLLKVDKPVASAPKLVLKGEEEEVTDGGEEAVKGDGEEVKEGGVELELTAEHNNVNGDKDEQAVNPLVPVGFNSNVAGASNHLMGSVWSADGNSTQLTQDGTLLNTYGNGGGNDNRAPGGGADNRAHSPFSMGDWSQMSQTQNNLPLFSPGELQAVLADVEFYVDADGFYVPRLRDPLTAPQIPVQQQEGSLDEQHQSSNPNLYPPPVVPPFYNPLSQDLAPYQQPLPVDPSRFQPPPQDPRFYQQPLPVDPSLYMRQSLPINSAVAPYNYGTPGYGQVAPAQQGAGTNQYQYSQALGAAIPGVQPQPQPQPHSNGALLAHPQPNPSPHADPKMGQNEVLVDITNMEEESTSEKQAKKPKPKMIKSSAKEASASPSVSTAIHSKKHPAIEESPDDSLAEDTELEHPKWVEECKGTLHYLLCTSNAQNAKNLELVNKYLLFEKLFAFNPTVKGIAVDKLPPALKWFTDRNHDYLNSPPLVKLVDCAPDLIKTNAGKFAHNFIPFYKGLMPPCRAAKGAVIAKRVSCKDKDFHHWKKIGRGGKNGISLVMLCLGWWYNELNPNVEGNEEDSAKYTSVVDDCLWVLDCLLTGAEEGRLTWTEEEEDVARKIRKWPAPASSADTTVPKATKKRKFV